MTDAVFTPNDVGSNVTVNVFELPGAIFPAGVIELGVKSALSVPDIFILSTLKLSELVFWKV